MDSYCFLEEELLTKMHANFINRFSLDRSSAAELALEVLEALKLNDSNMNEVKNIFFN